MAVVNASLVAFRPHSSPSLLPSTSHSHFPSINSPKIPSKPLTAATTKGTSLFTYTFALKNSNICETEDVIEEKEDAVLGESSETLLLSFSPLGLLLLGALPGASTVTSLFSPFVELVKSWNLLAVVLFAMGGYGTYLGFRIRFSDDVEEKAKAKDLHPKLLGGMFFFFALGATGGFIGLTLLTIQTILPALFEGNPGLRNVHGILGSGIMTLFLVHAALGLQLGLSY
ncbi:hypothetical protein DH2020_017969 [Rehmannia glutinosa]|uniref:Uncharacterized protein n=1 Tax=Rehmannia glutinosa TaxID=99300 RepID=A0ABR0WL46_REHGL